MVDINDVEGYQKMSKVYDQLMKSGKFTALQNKGESNNFVDSIGELVALCEEEGYIPRFYTESPQDRVDAVLADTKTYLRTLVTEEMNLGNLIEVAARQIQEEKIREQETSDDSILDDIEELEEEIDMITEEDFEDFNDFIEEQKMLDIEEDE